MFGTYCRLDLPISATALDVIRATRRKFKRAARSDRAQRDARHAVRPNRCSVPLSSR